ncbi:MAG: MCE family protein [Actinomycetota bacterium]
MITRFIRVQLIIFTIASVVAIAAMALNYLRVPTFLGVGKISVSLDLPASGGLYRFANVTYRGVQIGKVVDVRATAQGATAELSLDTSPNIPADLHAAVRSVSAVGEQYVDLQPRTDTAPYLRDGSVIPVDRTSVPQEVGPMLDQVNALVQSIPKGRLHDLLDESFAALNGAGDDFGSLLDSSSTVMHELEQHRSDLRSLADKSGALVDSQVTAADSLRIWSRSTAGITRQVVDNDPQVRAILRTGPSAVREVTALLDSVKPTLPILLANLTTLGQVGMVYHPSLQQLLVLLPPYVSFTQSAAGFSNSTGSPLGDFSLTVGDPPPCTVGFLPPSSWRNPADTTDIDTPDGLYCKLPQDSPIAVRGVRNFPCMGKPGKRAPTVDICESDQPFRPLAARQHSLGPSPLDPNLLAQGIPPDDRVTLDENIRLPLGEPPPAPPPPPADMPEPTPHTPSASAPARSPDGETRPNAAVAAAQYDPRTGRYAGTDGKLYTDTSLRQPAIQWQQLVLPG